MLAPIATQQPCQNIGIRVTGRRLTAEEAVACGLVTRIEPADGAVEELLGRSAPVLAAAKRAMRAGTLRDAESIYQRDILPLDDCFEGIRAFLEKRPPDWKHR